jgi:hypothetical protein
MCFKLHSQIQYKVKAGINLATLKRDYGNIYGNMPSEGSQRSQAGFQIGGIAEKKIIKQLHISSELLYTQKGQMNLNPIRYFSGASVKLHYLELPVLLKWKSNKNISLAAGPSVSYLIKAVDRYLNERTDYTEAYKRIDFGVNGDISYEREKLGIGVRYTYGFNKMNMRGRTEDPEFPSAWRSLLYGRNQVWQFYATYSL